MSVGPWVPAELTEYTPAMGFSASPEPASGSARPAAEDADIRPSRPSGTGCVQEQCNKLECGKCLQQQLHTTRTFVYEQRYSVLTTEIRCNSAPSPITMYEHRYSVLTTEIRCNSWRCNKPVHTRTSGQIFTAAQTQQL